MLPQIVVEKAKSELTNWNNTNLSVMEMSHRSSEYLQIHQQCINDIRIFFSIPQNYTILLMHGGATLQYSAIPMNLLKENEIPTYLITGQYSEEAFNEAKKFCNPQQILLKDIINIIDITTPYLYYVENETNDGLFIQNIPKIQENTFLVCDMTSSFGTKQIDINKYGCIFASLQCNIGIPGLCCVIIRDDLIGRSCNKKIPSMANYKIMQQHNSIYNTVSCYNIYITGLCVQYYIQQTLKQIEIEQKEKAELFYSFLDSVPTIYQCKIQQKDLRSLSTVVFKCLKNNQKININELINLKNGWLLFKINGAISKNIIIHIISQLNQLII